MQVSTHQRGSLAYVSLLTAVAALGGLLFGYDTAVIAGVLKYLTAYFTLTPFWEGFAAASALAGCALGAGTAGLLGDGFGRKKVLVLAALAFLISAVGTAIPRTLAEFIIFRFIGGVGIGAASIVSPMYIAEITPFRIRGRMVSLNQFAIVLGMLIVYFVNYFIAEHGLAVDRQRVADHVAQHGQAIDKAFAEKFLAARTPEVVNQQVEQFLVNPKQTLDRRGLAEYLESQGVPTPAGELAADDQPLPPARVRDLLRDRLTQGVEAKNAQFLAEAGNSLTSQSIVDYLAKSEIKVAPAEVDLAAQGAASWNVESGWRWMFASGVLPSLLFLVLLLLVPESPRWLTGRGRRAEALAILTRVDGPEFAADEIRGIEENIAKETGALGDLFQARMRGVLAVGIALAVLQQVTGINVFLYFAPRIFESLGAGESIAMLQTVIVGAVNMAFTVLAVAVVDRVGRRPLMLLGAAGMGVVLVGLGLTAYWQLFQWWALVFILGYIAFFAMSVGPVTWVILSEIFPTQIRGRAMGLATICLWLANYVVSLTYPVMANNPWLLVRFHQGFPFWVYAAFCVLLVFVVWRFVPETKGKTLEEIERTWLK